MNLYTVMSEEIWYTEKILAGSGPREIYIIAELVIARNRSQATWLAWKSDPAYWVYDDIHEMPKFSVHIKKHGVAGPARIVTEELGEEGEALWGLNEATSTT